MMVFNSIKHSFIAIYAQSFSLTLLTRNIELHWHRIILRSLVMTLNFMCIIFFKQTLINREK